MHLKVGRIYKLEEDTNTILGAAVIEGDGLGDSGVGVGERRKGKEGSSEINTDLYQSYVGWIE